MNIIVGTQPVIRIVLLVAIGTMCFNIMSLFLRARLFCSQEVPLNNLASIRNFPRGAW